MPNAFNFASNGTSGDTTVTFPTGSSQNLAINYPADYCQNNPKVMVPCYANGSVSGSGNENALVSFDYDTNTDLTGRASS